MNLIHANTWTVGSPQFMEDGRSFQFTKDDLTTAISVLKHGKNDVISNQIRKILRNGLYNNIPSPISKKSYYLWYGHSTGNMKLVDDYLMMADMLVVGKQPVAVGNLLEVFQWGTGQASGMDPQDFYSNGVGYQFYMQSSSLQRLIAPTTFTDQLNSFFSNPRVIYNW